MLCNGYDWQLQVAHFVHPEICRVPKHAWQQALTFAGRASEHSISAHMRKLLLMIVLWLDLPCILHHCCCRTELFPYETCIFYTVITTLITLERVDLKNKVQLLHHMHSWPHCRH